jgi:hypothetical protein
MLMGRMKALAMEISERGYGLVPDKAICDRHVDDDWLRDFIRSSASEKRCDYCGRTSGKEIACSLEVVVEIIADVLHTYWGDANDEGVPYDGSEGGWQGEVTDAWNVLEDHFRGDFDEECWEDIFGCFLGDSALVEHPYGGLVGERLLTHGWRDFCETVKHQKRYIFLRDDRSEYEKGMPEEMTGIPPGRMLRRIGDLARSHDLIKVQPAGWTVYRAHVHKPDEKLRDASRIGTAPVELATTSSRMSPAGVPMFYGAESAFTATAEVWTRAKQNRGWHVTVGEFITSRKVKILDLTQIPNASSVYDTARYKKRENLLFLRYFARDLCQPIPMGPSEPVEYVPTQIVTEYFRHGPSPVDGIRYKSACDPDGICVVLFVENDECVDLGPGWDDASHYRPWKRGLLRLGMHSDVIVDDKPAVTIRQAETIRSPGRAADPAMATRTGIA